MATTTGDIDEVARSIEFTASLSLQAQQYGARIPASFMNRQHVGEAAVAVEQIGKRTAQTKSGRLEPTPLVETQHEKRWVYPLIKHDADAIDKHDFTNMLVSPQSEYTTNLANGVYRAWDEECGTRFFADAKAGKEAGTTRSFDSNMQVSASEGASAATGMNLKKLREAKKLLEANEIPMDGNLFAVLNSDAHDNLLGEIQATSRDYVGDQPIVSGGIRERMGVQFIRSELLPTNGSGQRRIPVYHKTGMHFGTWQGLEGDISVRRDLSNAIQFYVDSKIGAVRLEEAKVAEIPCAES